MPKKTATASPSTREYAAKTSHEVSRLAQRGMHTGPEPFGDPLSGVVLVAEPPAVEAGRTVDALRRSLAAVKLDLAYVTWTPPSLEEILALEPTVLVAVGPTAARSIDTLHYPLAKTIFSESPEGSWFAWTEGTAGLKLPALDPALDDADAKRRFWRAFLALRVLSPDRGP
jgi:ABC-type Fe3+-hydroxamate transport system substrate-binding protein